MNDIVAAPFALPMYVMLKPAGSACNLGCDYCYYLEKGSRTVMNELLLEEYIRQYIASQNTPQILFTWHGGEPLLRPLGFYRKALELQRRYAGGRRIDNCLQTNGTLLTDEWCEFLRDNRFLVGISIDGPQPLHDACRRSTGGASTWLDVMRGIRLLQRHGVEWNAMATVNAVNVEHPKAFYHFFRDIGCEFLQFTPVTDKPGRSITADRWGRFLCSLYDEWVKEDVGKIYVQLFDATLANWVGAAPGVCSMSATCGLAPVVEADGSVYCCDHFVSPAYRLGNILEQPLSEMLYGEKQMRFGQSKKASLPRQCRECRWLFACHGECPKNRLVTDRYGEPGLNCLCGGYRQFFAHVAADMEFMKTELEAGRPPSNICKIRNKHPS
ncbi:MAG: anaerobic sulfatase-maturation protein [Duncaniella sp.]|nr:anaerobic sulfatase-maturation protein [Duncaniella sp.]